MHELRDVSLLRLSMALEAEYPCHFFCHNLILMLGSDRARWNEAKMSFTYHQSCHGTNEWQRSIKGS